MDSITRVPALYTVDGGMPTPKLALLAWDYYHEEYGFGKYNRTSATKEVAYAKRWLKSGASPEEICLRIRDHFECVAQAKQRHISGSKREFDDGWLLKTGLSFGVSTTNIMQSVFVSEADIPRMLEAMVERGWDNPATQLRLVVNE